MKIKSHHKLETYKNSPAVIAPTLAAWRKWLSKNHNKEKSAWLIIFRKASGKKCVNYDEAVEEALCFGWIDSTANPRDGESSYRYFAVRKPNSKWSKINRDKAVALIEQGRMRPAGLAEVERAKTDGRWQAAYDGARTSSVPDDLVAALAANPAAAEFFETLDRQNRFAILYRVRAGYPTPRPPQRTHVVAGA